MEPTRSIIDNIRMRPKHLIKLDDSYAKVKQPAGLRTVHLYPHQMVAVQAMLDIEDNRVFITKDYADPLLSAETILETNSMVLSEPLGSGKTIEILALILIRPIPRPMPSRVNTISLSSIHSHKHNIWHDHIDLTQRFSNSGALIRPNLIVVGSSVVEQWTRSICKFTNLKVFVISNFHKLRKFYALFSEGKIQAYDIVLLKNGKVTGTFVLPGETVTTSYRSLITVVGNITERHCWSRVIYDDFDTISIPSDACSIYTLFTVYVSMTTKNNIAQRAPPKSYDTILELLRDQRTPLNKIYKDSALFRVFNVRNKKEFVEKCTKMPQTNVYQYVFNNPYDNYIRLIGTMGGVDADDIMEMLNGDAIHTAADALGIKTDSVADIFQRLLDKKYKAYIYDQDVLAVIADTQSQLKSLDEGQHSIAELEAVYATIKRKIIPELNCTSTDLVTTLENMRIEFEKAKIADGLAKQRVIDNLKDGMCQICTLPLEEFDVFIVRCCGIIVCDECGVKGNQIKKRRNHADRTDHISGFCANCKREITPQDLIFVDRSFDLESIIEARGDEVAGESLPEICVEKVVEEIINPKLRALLKIIQGMVPESQQKIPLKIPGVIYGTVDAPPPQNQIPKVLVFASYNETLLKIEDFLREQEIPFLRLSGTCTNRANIVDEFKQFGRVLLINSTQSCAGLDLQFSTDLVYFHKIVTLEIESQVAGRIIRIGRQYNANIHYLCYKNEKAK